VTVPKLYQSVDHKPLPTSVHTDCVATFRKHFKTLFSVLCTDSLSSRIMFILSVWASLPEIKRLNGIIT